MLCVCTKEITKNGRPAERRGDDCECPARKDERAGVGPQVQADGGRRERRTVLQVERAVRLYKKLKIKKKWLKTINTYI